jgi:hypothetical protein
LPPATSTIRPTRDALTGISVAITDRRRSPPRRRSARRCHHQHRYWNRVLGRSSRSDRRRDPEHGQHRLHFRDYLHGERRGSFTYTPGSSIDVDGWRIQVNGAPATGDRFTVRSNAGATGDNRTALALADA